MAHDSDDQGEFRKIMEAQHATGGFLPKDDTENNNTSDEALDDDDDDEEVESLGTFPAHLKHQSIAI